MQPSEQAATQTVRGAGSSESASPAQARAAEVGSRLRESMRTLIAAFPPQARSASEMSRWLEVMRPNCQRVLLGIRAADEPLEALQRFPGTKALRQFVAAAGAKGIDPRLIAEADAAVEAYADLIGEFGGSQSRLAARLASMRSARDEARADPDDRERLRRAGFECAAGVSGYRCQARIEVLLVRVMPSDPGRLEAVLASGLVGATRRPGGMPICRMHRTVADDRAEASSETLSGEDTLGFTPGSLIPGFSSTGVPSINRPLDDGWLIEVFDEEGRFGPVDLVVGNRHSPATEHPALTELKIYNRGVLIGVPAEHLVMDVYLERSLARSSVATCSPYFMGMMGAVGLRRPDARWFDQIPDGPTVQQLGPGLRHAAHPAYERHRELTAFLFEAAGWSAERFVGFRCDEAWPLWGAEYVMSFDFSDDAA